MSRLAPGDHATALAGAGALVGALAPGYDFSRELLLTTELALGDTAVVMGSGDSMDAMVLWHSAPLAADRASEELRILKLAARNTAAFDAALAAAEASAAHAGLRRVAIRCQTRYETAFRTLVARGYQVRWTDLRMNLDGYPEQHAEEGVLFSNWEI